MQDHQIETLEAIAGALQERRGSNGKDDKSRGQTSILALDAVAVSCGPAEEESAPLAATLVMRSTRSARPKARGKQELQV